jgi:hypothetical protein
MSIDFIFWLVVITGVVYYAIKRFLESQKEDFEDRDN